MWPGRFLKWRAGLSLILDGPSILYVPSPRISDYSVDQCFFTIVVVGSLCFSVVYSRVSVRTTPEVSYAVAHS